MKFIFAAAAVCCVCALVTGQNARFVQLPDQNATGLMAKYEEDVKTNPRSSIAHFRLGEIYLQQSVLQSAANSFREALNGDVQPRWVEVWSRINLGKIFDMTGQRDRAINEYHQAQRTQDNTRGAMDEAAIYLEFPYPSK